jgi:hypothetical protein
MNQVNTRGEVCKMDTQNRPEYYPEPCPVSPEERAAIIAKLKAEFSAADLQRFTEVEEGIALEDVIKQLEQIDRETSHGSI